MFGIFRLRRRAEEGDAQSQFDHARALAKGTGVAVNFTDAARFYLLSASKGIRKHW
jgi:TPR repeat protein